MSTLMSNVDVTFKSVNHVDVTFKSVNHPPQPQRHTGFFLRDISTFQKNIILIQFNEGWMHAKHA